MIDIITGIIGNFLYPLFSIIFIIIDTVQSIFMALAGVGGSIGINGQGTGFYANEIVNTNSGNSNDSGLIFYLLNTELVKNLLISITMLAVFLLIIFTVMAFIKNVYAAKQKNWQEIVGSALKGLLSFVFIPVCCLLGVWVSNIVLQAINGATSTGGSIYLSRKLFVAAAYNANSYRLGTKNDDGKRAKNIYKSVYGEEMPEYEAGSGITKEEYYASMVDKAYGEGDGNFCINIYVQWGVADGYSLWNINYLLLGIVGCFMIYVLVTLAYAMVRRMFILLMLFVISPAICAMYPLDDGSAVGQWRKNFISTTLGAYGAVAGMNIFLSLLPIIDQLGFTFASNKAASPLIDELIRLFMMVAGLFIVKEMMQMISGYVGGDDAYSKGSGLRASTKGAIKKKVTGATKTVASAFGAAAGANARGKSGVGAFFASMGSDALSGATNGMVDIKGTAKTFLDARAGKIKDIETKDKENKDKADLEDVKTGAAYKSNKEGLILDENTGKPVEHTYKTENNAGKEVEKTSTIGDLINALKENVKEMTQSDRQTYTNNLFDMLRANGANDSQIKLVAGEMSDIYNRHGTDKDGNRKTWSADKMLEDWNANNNRKALLARQESAQEGYGVAVNERDAATQTKDSYYEKSGLKMMVELASDSAGKTLTVEDLKVSEADYKKLERTAQEKDKDGNLTAAAQGARNELEIQDKIREYEGLERAADQFEEKVNRAAEAVANAMQAVADAEKNVEIKGAMTGVSEDIRNALAEGVENIGEVISDSVKRAIESSSEKGREKLEKIFAKLIKDDGKGGSGGGAGKP